MNKQLETAERIAARFAELEIVEAVALGGSAATGLSSEDSDIDVYVYTSRAITMAERDQLSSIDSEGREVIDFWGPGDMWTDTKSGVEVDIVHWTSAWIEAQLSRTLERYGTDTGYSTAIWHTIRVSKPLYDKNGWFASLQEKANQAYPDALVQNILRQNFPLLRQIRPSYYHQTEKAVSRGDWLSVNHCVTWIFACYFDIIFAVNRLPHPGEKRQLEQALKCPNLPANFQANIEAILQDTGKFDDAILLSVKRLLDELESWLTANHLL